MLRLQGIAGNQAVQRLLQATTPPQHDSSSIAAASIQRGGGEGDAATATTDTENEAEGTATWQSWYNLTGAYTKLTGEIALANTRSRTLRRAEIGKEIEDQWKAVGKPGDLSLEELEDEWETFQSLKDDLEIEVAAARERWDELVEEYETELMLLAEEGDRLSSKAAELLTEGYNTASGRVDKVGDFLVEEDYLALSWMLQEDTHISGAEREVQREDEEIAKAEAEVAKLVDEDEPGIGSMAWAIFGWDSPGEFVGDVALTLLTGGISKLVRWGRKARRAAKARKKARRARRASRARRSQRLQEAADRLMESLRSISEQPETLQGFRAFIQAKGPELARKITTDMLAGLHSGTLVSSRRGLPSVAVSRASKEFIAATLEGMKVVPTKAEEKKAFKSAVTLFIAGNSRLGTSMLKHYLGLNFKRRGLVNVVHVMLTGTADSMAEWTVTKETKLGIADAMKKIVTATVFEMGEDLIKQLGPLSKSVEALLELGRKTVQKLVEAALKG